MCGGTGARRVAGGGGDGLSPRVRGNRSSWLAMAVALGPIPACAGEPDLDEYLERLERAYPRVCGGTANPAILISAAAGLSPRVRGNPLPRCHKPRSPGPIPACAGEPFDGAHEGCVSRAYPRVCGGTQDSRINGLGCSGLSPRVRGNRHQVASATGRVGPIPACAGEPKLARSHTQTAGAYPRVCGGTPCDMKATVSDPGLSPRVRGNHQLANNAIFVIRPIPACAGEPAAALS